MVQPALEGLVEVNQAKGSGWLSRQEEGHLKRSSAR